jgi:molecular chaperone GrpE
MTNKNSPTDAAVPVETAAADTCAESNESLNELDEESLEAFAQLAAERDQYKDQLLRSLADLQNYRRRTEQQMEEFRRYATEDLVRRLLPILDNFERANQAFASGASAEATLEGLLAIEKQLRSALAASRVERIVALGQPFDPELHEAVATEVDPGREDGTVIEELESGYRMADRVIRPTKAKVSRKS